MDSNPFATRFIRAGNLPYQFAVGTSIASLNAALIAANWRGEIVGPHGSGKSTLLQHLKAYWQHWDRDPVSLSVQQGRVFWPPGMQWSSRTQVIVDGFEQLPLWRRWMVHFLCRRQRCGLLVTCHRSLLPPTLVRTATDLRLARQLVDQLTRSRTAIDETQLETAFEETSGNLRETFLYLYDVWQQQHQR